MLSLGITLPVGLPGLDTIMHLGIMLALIDSVTRVSNSTISMLQSVASFK